MAEIVKKKQRSQLDESIDTALSNIAIWVWRSKFVLLALLTVGFLFWAILLPRWAAWGPFLGTAIFFMFYLIFAVAMMILQFVALFWFLGRGRTYWVMPGETGVGYADYKGNPEVLEQAERIVTLLRGVKEFKAMGGEHIRGLLLVGPPGTGKSYLAQVISTEAKVPFGYASAPSFQNMFMGIGNLRVMMLYGKAKKLARKFGACILFIDEIDAIGASRSGQGPGMPMGMGGMFMGGGGSGILNELLLQMDPPPQEEGKRKRLLRALGLRRGKADMPPVLTIGATNMPQVLDPALVRPGRFDRKITVDMPDADGREEILRYYLAKVTHGEMPMKKMISDTIGYSPVAIKHVINEAVVHAHFAARTAINYEDFTSAREAHEWGLRQPIKSMSQEEKRRVAFHEAGHAFAQLRLVPRERLSKVTIIRHGQALGLSASKPLEEIYTRSREELMADIQVSLASRAAEEIFLGTRLSGVTSDFAQATRVATACVNWYGMDGSLYSTLAFNEPPDASSRKAVDKLLKEQFQIVKQFVGQNRDYVQAVAEALLARNELDDEEVRDLIAKVDAARALSSSNGPGNGSEATPTRPEAAVSPLPTPVAAATAAEAQPDDHSLFKPNGRQPPKQEKTDPGPGS